MSSGVSDRYKRQGAAVSSGKPMDERDAIPWSQQVDEDLLYENLSYTENKSGYSSAAASVQFQNPPFIIRPDNCPNQKHKKTYPYESKNKCCQPPCDCTDSKRTDDINSDKKVKSYNTKKDNFSFSQKMLARDTQQKMVFGDSPVGTNEDHKLADEGSSMANESNKKKITWASIASQPAKPNKRNNNISLKKKGPGMPPPPMIPGKHSLDINTWDFSASNIASPETSESIPISIPTSESVTPLEVDLSARPHKPHIAPEQQSNFGRKQVNAYSKKPIKHVKTNNPRPVESVSRDRRYIQKHNEEQNQNQMKQQHQHQHQPIASSVSNYKKDSFDGEPVERGNMGPGGSVGVDNSETMQPKTADVSHVVLKQLKDRNNYNPPEMDLQTAALSRFFVIKSYSEDDIHRSIKYEIWCSTDHGNKRLDEAFKERVKEGGNVMLFFSVNGSGHFCGMAQMMTSVDYNSISSVWSQDKWKGKFKVRWIYVKDVPNTQLRHIRLENNENKSVTNSRDTQEVPIGKGLQVLKILHSYKHQTSIFDDFYHYEKKQEESVLKKPTDNYAHSSSSMNVGHNDGKEQQLNNDRYGGGGGGGGGQHFRDRIVSHRGNSGNLGGGGGGGGGGHHNFFPNRRYGKNTVENQPNKDEKEKSIGFISQDRENNETVKHNLQRYTNPSVDNCSSKRNNTEIILHVTNFNCNENNIVRKNPETK